MPFDAANPRGPGARWFSQGVEKARRRATNCRRRGEGKGGLAARERAPAESAEA